jgi:hypothetical protein
MLEGEIHRHITVRIKPRPALARIDRDAALFMVLWSFHRLPWWLHCLDILIVVDLLSAINTIIWALCIAIFVVMLGTVHGYCGCR